MEFFFVNLDGKPQSNRLKSKLKQVVAQCPVDRETFTFCISPEIVETAKRLPVSLVLNHKSSAGEIHTIVLFIDAQFKTRGSEEVVNIINAQQCPELLNIKTGESSEIPVMIESEDGKKLSKLLKFTAKGMVKTGSSLKSNIKQSFFGKPKSITTTPSKIQAKIQQKVKTWMTDDLKSRRYILDFKGNQLLEGDFFIKKFEFDISDFHVFYKIIKIIPLNDAKSVYFFMAMEDLTPYKLAAQNPQNDYVNLEYNPVFLQFDYFYFVKGASNHLEKITNLPEIGYLQKIYQRIKQFEWRVGDQRKNNLANKTKFNITSAINSMKSQEEIGTEKEVLNGLLDQYQKEELKLPEGHRND